MTNSINELAESRMTLIESELFNEIRRLKKAKNAVLLAHFYQDPVIQEISDFVGDSLGLSQQAANTQANIIVFAGVHFTENFIIKSADQFQAQK